MFFRKNKPPSHERAMQWFKANMVADQGIIVHTRERVPYPEVTGYFIPTLYNWGEQALARSCTRWLLSTPGEYPLYVWRIHRNSCPSWAIAACNC